LHRATATAIQITAPAPEIMDIPCMHFFNNIFGRATRNNMYECNIQFYICQPIFIDIANFTVLVVLHLYFLKVYFLFKSICPLKDLAVPPFLIEWVGIAVAVAGA
jgi:hypothetical protein